MTEDLTVIQNTHDFTRFLTLSLICNTTVCIRFVTIFIRPTASSLVTYAQVKINYVLVMNFQVVLFFTVYIVIAGLTYVQFGGYSCHKPYTLLEHNKEKCNGWKNADKMTCIQVRGLVKATHLLSLE